MYMLESERSAVTLARLYTSYTKTDGKCVELYYWIRGGSRLELKIRGEDYIERLLAIKSIVSKMYSLNGGSACVIFPCLHILYILENDYAYNGPRTRYMKLWVAHAQCFSCHLLQRKPLVSDPGMHHGTYVTHVRDACRDR